jgi:glycerate-2-kinase
MHLQEDAKNIFYEALRACDTHSLIKKRIQLSNNILRIDDDELLLTEFSEILLIGFGKASIEMGMAIEEILGDKLTQGILVTNRCRSKTIKSEIYIAGHPLPDRQSLMAARRILEAIRASIEKTLVIFVISGGGSSLVELPQFPITLEELQKINQLLVTSGATIFEINLIRKSISQIKGGKLGIELGEKKGVAIYLSDVNSDAISTIASGPLIPETIDRTDVLRIFNNYNLLTKIPGSVLNTIHKTESTPALAATTTPLNIKPILLADNYTAIDTAQEIAKQKGYQVDISRGLVEGDYRKVADELISRLINLVKRFPNDRVCMISGGEVNCAVKGKGVGGRNQEFVLYSASKLAELKINFESAILSAGTDGIDGVSVASGAVMSRHRLSEIEQSLLIDNDSHSLIRQIGGLIVLGPTGNNIRDLRLYLASPASTPKN